MSTGRYPVQSAPPGYLTPKQVSDITGKHIDTIRDAIKSGLLTASSIPGSHRVFIRLEAMRRYAERIKK